MCTGLHCFRDAIIERTNLVAEVEVAARIPVLLRKVLRDLFFRC